MAPENGGGEADRQWIEVGCLDDIPRRGSRRVRGTDAGVPIALFRTAEDVVFALVDRCPHRAGPLSEGIVQGCAVACPLHGWVIDLASGQAEAPDEGSVPIIAVRVEDGRILISAAGLVAAHEVLARAPKAA
ncbi:MAG TPA: nitrite reductase small subunit NirD [Stellaceae bacterium]|jgi:nitrite reductase (NADH) small subunit|nr:nitrite reductase small subunit NirD [Stellaceae bacterium]